MKNKTSLLTIATLSMLAACGSKTEIMKSGLADKFADKNIITKCKQKDMFIKNFC